MSNKTKQHSRFDRANNPVVEAFQAAARPLVFNTKVRNAADADTVALARTVVKETSRLTRDAEDALKIQEESRKEALERKVRINAEDAILAQRKSWAKEYGYKFDELDQEFVQAE